MIYEATERGVIAQLLSALKLLRGLIDEGGVPRYTVTPGAALNSVIEEDVDPAIRLGESILTSSKGAA